ncbi:MAG: site-specific integrase [Faecalibacterium prausnitzii]|nr:site-specific integrase [Faecalibacterium prausnitzii]
MAYITKRGNSYSVRYTYEDEHGKSCDKWESFPTKEEATNRKKQIEHELAAGTFLIPSSVTVAEFLMDWLPKQCSKHKWAPKTYESNLSTIQNLIIPYIGSMEMQKLKPYHMENLYTTLSKTPCGSYVDSPKKSTQERSIWTVEEMRAALDSMDDPILHLAVHLTLVGALREGEIVGLTPEDIDFDAADGIGTFRINKSMQRVRKEALNQVDDGCIIKVFPDKLERSTTSLILKSTKTASSCRTIFMTSALKEELKKWLNQLAADEMKDPARYHDSGMLFRLPNGLAVEPVLIRKKFLKWQDAHPEFPRIVFHGLRHSSATYQLMISGGDVKAVQGTTGHATADMLVNTYAHIQQSSRVELGRKFEEGFYAKQESPSPQAVPAAGEPTISMTALLELLKNADPEVKAQLRLALLT